MDTGETSDTAIISRRDRYRGCLLGALVGDCIGQLFEGDCAEILDVPIIYSSLSHNIKHHGIIQYLPYTDDTAMTHALVESLLRSDGVDLKDVAKSFADRYYGEKTRQAKYAKVTHVFKAWRDSNYSEDLFAPSKAQFDGKGSWGNGGGMRIAGVPLFLSDNIQDMVEAARITTQLTHYHPSGYSGAMLQAYAVHLALTSSTPDAQDMMTGLNRFIHETLEPNERERYSQKLEIIGQLLHKESLKSTDVIKYLGHSVEAHQSIPTAIFCAIRGLWPIPTIETKNPVERTIIYAISLGGDTDTIATMAGAIAGAWFGEKAIPKDWRDICEDSDKTVQLADALCDAVTGRMLQSKVQSPD